MDKEIQSNKSEAKDLQDKLKGLEEHRRYELRRRSPEGSEIGESMGEEIRKLRLALDGKINELKKFKEGYSNSKREHERVKKGLNKEIEELKMRLRQNKEEEDKSEDLENRNYQDEGLDEWRGYVEEDLNNIIWKMEKLEDDLNMKIGSRSDLQEETKNLVKFMKKTL